MLNTTTKDRENLVRFRANPTWVIEERVALVPVIGKFVSRSLPRSDLHEYKLAFGDHSNQYIATYWPEVQPLKKRTAIYFLHGGGWSSGNPSLFRFIGQFFAGLGYPTILGGYRLAPDYRFPDQLEDAAHGLEVGVDFLRFQGMTFDNLILGGQSAGGHLASLLVYGHGLLKNPLRYKPLFGGFFSISSPLDFDVCTVPSLQKMISDLLGDHSDSFHANPINHIDGDEKIPALLIHGDRDPLVDLENSISFATRLAKVHSIPVKIHVVHGGHHADLATIFVRDLPATRVLTNWLNQYDKDD
jgi:acetyl esterase/lipase